MGGGDLNLKKSWHPSTMKNMEKVWKAEQQQSQEKKKIAELKREIEMEKDREDIKKYAMEQGVIEKKDDKKLDWMYKGPNQLVNREEYLLGRPVDKSFEEMVQAEKDDTLNQAPKNHVEHECIPPSLRFFSGDEQVDLARKMQEDPLYAIKKKEMETRSQLLKNPVKLKQLLAQQSKEGKSEKKKKKKRKQDSDSEDEAQLDLLLTAKLKQLKDKISDKDLINSMKKVKCKRKKKSKRKSDTSSSESESSSEESLNDEDTKKHRKKQNKGKESNNGIKKLNKAKHLIDKDKERKHKVHEKQARSVSRENSDRSRTHKRDVDKNTKKISRSRSPRNREDSSHRNKFDKRSTIEDRHKDDSHKSYQRGTIHSKLPTDKSTKTYREDRDKRDAIKKQTLTEEEKERRRQEMMANAAWRDKERERNVKKYREEEKKEIDSRKVYSQDFVRKHLAVAAEIGTVASRIKSNINNIQRSGRAMDTNFAKR